MDYEAWWLILIPILFGLGWIAARVDVRQMMSETRQLPDSYFKGLNFLLNEDHDKAIDAFVEVAKLDTETIELHFALGNLFRRRGEIERAIRVHQSLLSRADLPKNDRDHAQHELAQDFFKAGMLDRAEQAYKAVLDSNYAVPASRALIRIYEAEHDWPKAIEAVRHLHRILDEPIPQLIHYHCELAQQSMQSKQPDLDYINEELKMAEQALLKQQRELKSNAAAVRIAMLRAKLMKIQGDSLAERKYLEGVMANAPEYAGLIAADLLENYKAAQEAQTGLDLLKRHYLNHPSLDLFKIVFSELRAQQGAAPAWDFASESLRLHPSLLGLDKLLEVELKATANGEVPNASNRILPDMELSLLHKMIHKHTQRLDRYSCSSCGFEARAFYWQCPGCNMWETYQPKKQEEM
ncbi:lipopolysaccharide assembly protein LapB [Advenella alkanexedens]|uniref:Lipopolysaccharide assembly protein B n=1 Tax=Advenella alkanexedens TaxID=1481665 RepID=A0ABS6NJP0_9BURK|nr:MULTISPECIES: lipopolysaccharide assembly protein LapB [Advenella]MBV4395853.1 lipopolysaccharide assembly protein LapB [Advenella alkanexedens]MDD3757357.1 lipopolysaccharide assembly protein LapB [Advenella sp.]WKU20823.1 lipopolysaccharide assembly protein LapB [Advenella alkanexedens]